MRDLEIKVLPVESDPQAAVVEMAGTLDGTTAPRFEKTIAELQSRGIRRVILHMAGLRYVNSTGLGTLVKHADELRSADAGMALIKVPGKVQIIIEMSGLIHLLVVCDDVPSALQALSVPGSGAHASAEGATSMKTSKWRSAAARLAAEDPEMAQRHCRKAIERALTNLYQQRIGDPAGLEMTQILQVLQQRGLVPTKVFALAYTVWELSDGSAPLGDPEQGQSREAYIAVAAMTVLQGWFKRVYPGSWS